MEHETFYLSINGETFRLVDFLANLEAEAADNGEDVDTELVSAILGLQVGESIGEHLNMETITRVARPSKEPEWKFMLAQIRYARANGLHRYSVRFEDGSWGFYGPKFGTDYKNQEVSGNPARDLYVCGTSTIKVMSFGQAVGNSLHVYAPFLTSGTLVFAGPSVTKITTWN